MSRINYLLVSYIVLLITFNSCSSSAGYTYDIVVAQDGTGNYTTINQALGTIQPFKSTRTIVYIKAGIYREYLQIPGEKVRIMLVGDGIGTTVITGNRSAGGGVRTYESATVNVMGNDFVARDLTIENSAGPTNGQAVALMSSSNHSAFYRCSFLGYQDTLYVHSKMQFYRECEVHGTVDFIFGDAAAVFQNCTFFARMPLRGQSNVFTAQGRESEDSTGGISVIACKFLASPELDKKVVRTFLGRPWKPYSRTIVMSSFIGDLVDSVGWLDMSNNSGLGTLYYREYMNTGPSSGTSGRVRWPGYQVINNPTEASMFTVENFIDGNKWLNETEVPFFLGLA